MLMFQEIADFQSPIIPCLASWQRAVVAMSTTRLTLLKVAIQPRDATDLHGYNSSEDRDE